MSALEDFMRFISNGSVLTEPTNPGTSMHINAFYDHWYFVQARDELAQLRTDNSKLCALLAEKYEIYLLNCAEIDKLQKAVEEAEKIFMRMHTLGVDGDWLNSDELQVKTWLAKYGRQK